MAHSDTAKDQALTIQTHLTSLSPQTNGLSPADLERSSKRRKETQRREAGAVEGACPPARTERGGAERTVHQAQLFPQLMAHAAALGLTPLTAREGSCS